MANNRDELIESYRQYLQDSVENEGFDITMIEDFNTWSREEYWSLTSLPAVGRQRVTVSQRKRKSMTKEQLLPDELRSRLPALEEAEERDPILQVKFFYPDFGWTWYGIEFDGEDIFFGLVDGAELEFGTFSLSELIENRGKLGCEIERDLYFVPKRVSELFPEIYKP
jgi:hypothetical protein